MQKNPSVKTANKRIFILLSLAAILAGIFAWDRWGGMQNIDVDMTLDAAVNPMSSLDSLADLLAKKSELENYQARASEIDQAYFQLAPVYTDRIASIVGLKTEVGGDDKLILEQILRDRMNRYASIENLKMSFAEAEKISKNTSKMLVDINFSTGSSQDAAKLLLDLGRADHGLAWRSFNVTADRNKKQIAWNGRLTVFLAEAAE